MELDFVGGYLSSDGGGLLLRELERHSGYSDAYIVNPYTLFAMLDDTGSLMAGAVLHYKGVVLDSIIEDRLLAETGKEEAGTACQVSVT